MTSTAAVEDVQALEQLDWDPVCDRRIGVHQKGVPPSKVCGRPAEYIAVRVCGCELFRCEPCVVAVQNSLVPIGVCRSCGDRRRRDPNHPTYIRLIPLRG